MSSITNLISVGVNGTGTANSVMKWLDADTATDSIIYDNGTNIGIGTSSPATRLQIGTTSDSENTITLKSDATGANKIFFSDGTGAALYAGFLEYTHSDNKLAFGTNSAERMRIDSSGNILIGSTSAGFTTGDGMEIQRDSASATLRLERTTTNTSVLELSADADQALINSRLSDPIVFAFGQPAVEKMRITSGGEVLFNSTSYTDGALNVSIRGYSGQIRLGTNTTATQPRMYFTNPNGAVGSINTSGTSTVYATSSDYRLKEDFKPISNALDRVDSLEPINFAWKADGSRVDGFLAHQVQEVVPEAITGVKDGMREEEYEVEAAVYEEVVHPAQEAILDEEGNVIQEAKEEWTEKVLVSEAVMGTRLVPEYQGIDQSKLVPLLVGAIQELKARIETLENK